MPVPEGFVSGRTFIGSPREMTRVDFVRYAGVSGDFNPLHVDEVSAQAAGQPSVFGHGMYSAGLLASAVAELVGLAHLRSYTVRFTRMVRPGESVTTNLNVVGIRSAGTTVMVDLDCTLESAEGVVLSGTAIAEYSA